MGFFRYDGAEMREAAARFVAALPTLDAAAAWTADPAVWEELLLDWWAAEAAAEARVDASPARPALTAPVRASVDWPHPRDALRRGPAAMVHSSHPAFGDTHPYSYAYWREAVAAERLEVLFAAQMELGGGGRAASRFGRVMLAASDLATLSARAKALFFSTADEAERRRLLEQLEALRLAAWDSRPWLYVDLAYSSDRAVHAPSWGMLEG